MAEAKCDRDAKSMSLDEFKEEMFRSLRDTGTVEMIRAQLRRKFIEKLQQHGMKDRFASLETGEQHQPSGSNNEVFPEVICGGDVDTKMVAASANRMQWSGDEKLVNGLLFDYFAKKALEHSAAVFVPEIGGTKNYVEVDTILQMMNLRPDQRDKFVLSKQTPLVVLLLHELSKHLSTHTMDSGTQTALDCHDHRLALENQLRRVETTYLTECENQKNAPNKSLEERMLQYQSEYDALSEKRVQEELERFKTMELALMRVEERKKYEREADTLRASLLQEQRQKSERLQEKERDLELAFVAKRTELETSLFETRQSLFQEMEKLRVKEAHLQVKVESDFRHFAAESKRLQLWEENVRAQEKNTARLVAQAIREKEHELQLERSRVNLSLKVREDELAERETVVECEKEAVKTEKLKRKALMDDVARMEERLQNMEQSLNDANKAVTRLEKENKRLQDAMDAKEANAEREKGSLSHLSALNARLAAEKELLQQEIDRYRVQMSEDEILVKQLTFELKDAQQQLLAIKMDEANALVGERKRFMKALDDDREQFQWKENELLVKLREFQGRLAESEAAVEKFHSQYEDEKLHVESLRQEVGNLNALLSQAQATINAKHGTVALHRSSRPVGGGGGSMEMGASAGGDFGSDRMMMIKMMEMMTRFQSGPQFMQQYPQPVVAHQSSIPVSYSPAYGSQTSFVPGATITAEQQAVENDEEDKKLRDEQLRIERELLEQREYERKKAERMAQEELEIAARKKLFDEELARQRQARVEEDERLESERRRKLAEEEQKMQSELEKQRRTLQEASELRQQLAEERSAADKQRMQDEQADQERMRAENLRLEQELEAKSLQKEKEEAEAEKRRREAEARKLQEQQQEEEEHEKQEKLKREVERQREEADVAAVEAARCEEAEEEQRRQRELEMLEKRKREEGKEREQATADLRLREEQEEQKLNDGDYAQDTHEREAPVLATDLLKTVEPDAHEVAPVADSVPESSQSAQSDEVGESESTAAAEVPSEAVNKLESSAVETTNEPKDERGDIGTTTPTAEEESRELTEEEQRQAEEEEKKKQADATMDIYRQRVLARKAAEKQKQLEMEAEAAARKRQEEEAEAERRRQEEQAGGDSGQEEMELSGGSFAESSAGSGSDSF